MLTQMSTEQTRYTRGRRDQDRETRFRIQRTIPTISADTGTTLLDEFDSFEEIYGRTNPSSPKDWVLSLEDA